MKTSATGLVTACVLLALVPLSSLAVAQEGSADFTPRRFTAYSTTEISTMDVECAPTAPITNRAQIRCDFHQVLISPPKSAADAESEAESDARGIRAEIAKDPKKAWTQFDSIVALALKAPPGEEGAVALARALAPAVKARDADGVAKVFGDAARKRALDTCSVTSNSFSVSLIRADAQSWEGWISGGGECAASSRVTIWRNKGELSANFRQVRMLPPTAPASCAPLGAVTNIEFKWNAKNQHDLSCKKFKL